MGTRHVFLYSQGIKPLYGKGSHPLYCAAPRAAHGKMTISVISFFHGTSALVGLGLLIAEVSRSHSDTPHSVGLLWMAIGPSLIPLPDNTQHSQQIDIHAAGGIRTRNTSRRAAADPRLRWRGHRVRQVT